MIEYDVNNRLEDQADDREPKRSPYEGCVDCFEVFDRMLKSMYGGSDYGNYD